MCEQVCRSCGHLPLKLPSQSKYPCAEAECWNKINNHKIEIKWQIISVSVERTSRRGWPRWRWCGGVDRVFWPGWILAPGFHRFLAIQNMPRTGRSVTNCAATRPNESKRKREGLEQRGETWLIYAAASCQLPVASCQLRPPSQDPDDPGSLCDRNTVAGAGAKAAPSA